jgi:UDP-glucose 4-epimerase
MYNNIDINPNDRILILGHSGYIGKKLYNLLCDRFSHLAIDGSSYSSVDLSLKDDMISIKEFLSENTIVIMCSGIKKQYGDSQEIFSKNIAMVKNICDLLKESPVKRFIYFSSAEVYGEEINNTDIKETTQVQPSSYYGIAKYTSEVFLKKVFEQQEQSSLVILRPALVYGPDEQESFYGPCGFIRTALKGEKILLWGDGDELREFLFINDLVEAVAGLIFHEFSGTVNIVSGKSYSFKEIINFISIFLPTLEFVCKPRTRLKVDQGYDNSLLMKLLPNLVFTNLESGVKNIYNIEAKN